jgi:pimeloyl-ACP methyl ester carboxylesterase/DNA-binding CsgD family transcriptional regulator
VPGCASPGSAIYRHGPFGRHGVSIVSVVEQEIRFVETEAGRLAFATLGTGPPLLISCWWVGHLEYQWESTPFRGWLERLAMRHTVVRYDLPGSGLSAAAGTVDGAAAEAAVSAALLDELGLGPAVVLGASCGGCSSVVLAATRPELVDRLLLYGAYANGRDITTPEVRESLVRLVLAHWGLGSQMLADVFMPDADAREREDFARYQRRATTAEQAADGFRRVYELEAERWLAEVAVPTLVVHRRGDRAVPIGLGRDLASRIPGARLVSVNGRDHFPWVGDVDEVLRVVLGFLGAPAPAPDRDDGPLSAREREVLGLIALGLSDGEIADQLVVSPHTVHRHVANVRRKLRQPSRAAAVAEAAQRGWL